ncbi:polysaccharide pyruvyl transferase family protein [Hoeflea sp. WL0058]|uniref:Polysaccharide pyruvyl transferase family protein n=1 Tax=Flavimaribacter sediminis TaxID=2865987 RepID=A0AAE3D352_9HYPH|nr:polysaccharide pyruvyl transferase family protein [Flavimaribacter sediminis]
MDYPDYLNPGDCAIWLGACEILSRIYGRPPDYASTLRGFDANRCVRAIGDGSVYFLGGGNLGALYAKHNRMRLAAIRAVPGCRVVLLPQSNTGLDREGDPLAADILETLQSHPDLTLLARDAASQRLFGELMNTDIGLCPDPASLCLPGPTKSGNGVACILRSDGEAALERAGDDGLDAWDWPDLTALRLWNRAGKLVNAFPEPQMRWRIRQFTARQKVDAALRALVDKQTVITDRLHGALFAEALGKRVIAIDNATAKISSYYETWRDYYPGITLANSLSEARGLAGSPG